MTQSALHAIPDDGRTDGLAHHEAHLRLGREVGTIAGPRDEEVDHQALRARALASSYRFFEARRIDQSVATWQHARGG
ncbi:hypothetical protein GCM10010197_08060 [Nocardioides luteus]|uniref:Uncharacterized protein n=1 Tax=Nocardioides luteus TaxID=1844 RepID=A0ABQ5SPI6_9ACTN|nr:hypothetical protein GCM10010197_08060 [Nocardioides luteus]GLJ66055.1 hypothetical protein GCM10017579_00910 [Nocardioides luteus]